MGKNLIKRALVACLIPWVTFASWEMDFDDDWYVANSSTAWTPNDLPGLALWFDASDSATITIGGGTMTNVSAWASKVGGYSATNAASGKYPVYEPTVAGGKPALRFDGGDSLIHGYSLTNNSLWSCFAVFTTYTTAPGYRAIIYANQSILFSTLASTGEWGTYFSAVVDCDHVATNLTVAAVIVQAPNSVTLSANGSPLVKSSGITFWQVGSKTIGSKDGTGEFFIGHVSELLLYPYPLDDESRKLVERYLGGKWGVAISE